MKEQFKNYPVEKVFKTNTVEDYVCRVVRISKRVHLSLSTMGACIDNIVKQYDNGNIKKAQGDMSHITSVRQAIKHYGSFYNNMNKATQSHLNEPQAATAVLAEEGKN